ncbi:hypothetical protein ACH4PU_32255 [Streptomyces sp. NPDC021100]|uniref:hypothetical protein n=1 Tax=Streptomyces sp. NPDC021100 TaxID=3365114 RepID=UPI0037953C2A
MPATPLVDHAALLRSRTLNFLRGPLSRSLWADLAAEGHAWTMPTAWTALPRKQWVEHLVTAEARRVASGVTFALDAQVVEAVRAVAADRTVRLPFIPEVLPAPSGMLVAEAPLHTLDTDGVPVIAATWGPALEGFAPGVHLTWWSACPDDLDDTQWPLFPDFDLHLPFAPVIDSRLWRDEQPVGLEHSMAPLRTVVAAWYALSHRAVTVCEQRPEASLGRALAAQKAKNRGVRTATATSPADVRKAVSDAATTRAAEILEKSGGELTGHQEPAALPSSPYGAFPPEHDHELDPARRRIASLYREGASRLHRLETEAAQVYPGVFEYLSELHAANTGSWNPCWVPSVQTAAWLVRQHGAPLKQAGWDAPRLTALAAWRAAGRHALLRPAWMPPHAPEDPAPVELAGPLPAPGLGLLVEDGASLVVMLAYVDEHSCGVPEVVLVHDKGDPAKSSFRDLTKLTLILDGRPGQTLTEAVRRTQHAYDQAAEANGTAVHPTDDADCKNFAAYLGYFTSPLAAACAPGASMTSAEDLTGRSSSASWPPRPSLLPEMTLWLPGSSPAE